MSREPTALIRVTSEALSRLLNLKDGARIDAAFMDADDIANDTISFRVRGAGPQVIEGAHYCRVPIEDMQNPPRLDEMGLSWIVVG